MRKIGLIRRGRRATVIGMVVVGIVVGIAGPAAADCDLGDVGRSGTAPSGSSVLVDGPTYVCIGSSWVG